MIFFNKIVFSAKLKEIAESYGSITDMANSIEIDRSHLSKFINLKLDSPPKPRILKKIADGSRGITTYNELMDMCGYVKEGENDTWIVLEKIPFSIDEFGYIHSEILVCNKGRILIDYTPPYKTQKEKR